MSVRIGVSVVAIVVACLGLSACTGGTGGDSESSTDASDQESSSSSATSQEEVAGERVSRSVASFVLPDGVEFTEKGVQDDAKAEFHQWSVTYPGTDTASCVIGLEIQSDVGDDALVGLMEEAKAMRSKDLQSAEMDPDAPEGLDGTVVTYAGTGKTKDGVKKDYTSIARTFQTEGNTLISIAINANGDAPKQCDPDAIAATLQWNGDERPVGEAK